MIAVRLEQWGTNPRIVSGGAPAPARGQTLVQVSAAAVSHLDLSVASGHFPLSPSLPYIPGVEAAGTVLVSERHPPGTAVVVRGAGVGLSRDGTWAEQIVVPDDALQAWPDGMSAALAASYFVPATTAHLALNDVGQATRDDTVLVVGAGGAVGSLACQLASRIGARVLGLARQGPPESMAPDIDWINPEDHSRLAQLSAARDITLIIDTVGGPGFEERLSWVAQGGRVAVVGYTHGSSMTLDVPAWLVADVAILPVNGLRRSGAAAACSTALARDLVEGSLHLAITSYPMSDAARAMADLAAGRVRGRAVLNPA